MSFMHMKELRTYCNDLVREHKMLDRELDKIVAAGDPAEEKILRQMTRVEREMEKIETVIKKFPLA